MTEILGIDAVIPPEWEESTAPENWYRYEGCPRFEASGRPLGAFPQANLAETSGFRNFWISKT